MKKRIGIVYHPKIQASKALADRLTEVLTSMKNDVWMCSSRDEAGLKVQSPGTALVISVGGDGTILRVARTMALYDIPIIGVNMGHLGFMTEFSPDEMLERLPAVLDGEGWVDERMMLQVEVSATGRGEGESRFFHGLNDAFVGRGLIPRLIRVALAVDGTPLTTYRSDGVIVATATGSTGYSLSVGGPILHPQSEQILINPVAAHLSLPHPLVLPPEAVVEMRVQTYEDAVLSIDGQINVALQDGDIVIAKRSPYCVRFLRMYPRDFFYRALEQRLKARENSR